MTDSIPNNQLKSIVDRLERLNEEKAAARDDYNEVLKEAAGNGWDQGALRRLIRRRAKDPSKRENEDALDALYQSSVGDL